MRFPGRRAKQPERPFPSFEEMPDDNRLLREIQVDFPRLTRDNASPCPIGVSEILRYLGREAPGGDALTRADLTFVRTARVADRSAWLWRFNEPDGGADAFVAVWSEGPGRNMLSYEDNAYGLTPEQFLLGDYHGVF